MFRKFARLFIGQRGMGGPNMPKRQPCPECAGWRKRARKTVAGAFYKCTRCPEEFFVVHRAAAQANHGRMATRAL